MIAPDSSNADDELLVLLAAGDLDGAVALLNTRLSVSSTPRSVSLLLARGRLLLALGSLQDALSDFNEAVENAPTDSQRAEGRLARAEAHVEAGRRAEARRDLNAIASLLTDPDLRSVAARLLARLDVEDGSIADAIGRLSNALAELPEQLSTSNSRAELRFDLAQALRLSGDAARSRTLLEELLVWAVDRPDWLGRIAFQLGITLAFAGRFDLAIVQYDESLSRQTDPIDRARILYNRAVASREIGDFKSAAHDLERANAENNGRDARIAFDSELLAGIVCRESDNLPAALDALRRAVELAPNGEAAGQARLEIGATLAATGLYGPAIDEFSAALALCSDEFERERAFRFRAVARREMGVPALAIDDFRAAIELTRDPNEKARGLMTCAALLMELGREVEAYSALSESLETELTDADVRRQFAFQLGTLATRRGDIDLGLGQLAEAERYARRGDDPVFLGQVLLNRGVALDIAGDSASAIELFRETTRLETSPELVYQAWMNLGRLYTDRAQANLALEAFGLAAAAADDRDARAMSFLSRGSAAMRWGRYVEADADFTRVLALIPNDQIATQARYYRGLTASLLGQLERARDDLTVTIANERDRDNRARALLDRGLIALSAGDFDAAERDIDEAALSFRRRADRATARVHLAAIHALQGRCATALEGLRSAAQMDPANDALAFAANDPRFDQCASDPEFRRLVDTPRSTSSQ